jgi:CRP-like cAMP-binding protein
MPIKKGETMSEATTNQLKKFFLFSGLPDDMLDALTQKVQKRNFASGEVIFVKGDEGDSMYVIETGWVKIVAKDSQGEELVLNQVGPGEAIGEMSLFDNEPRSAGVIALVDTSVLELKREDFENLLQKRPDIAISFIRSMSSRLRFSTTYIQKAIEWTKHVAEGDYSFIERSIPLGQPGADVSDQDKAGQLLSAFFQMVQGVKAREDDLKQQLEKLTFEIDQTKRKKEFEEITGSEFYAKLKEQAKELRAKRTDNK